MYGTISKMNCYKKIEAPTINSGILELRESTMNSQILSEIPEKTSAMGGGYFPYYLKYLGFNSSLGSLFARCSDGNLIAT